MLYEPPPQIQKFNWIWAKWMYGVWEKFFKYGSYPPLSGETGIENHEYEWVNVIRFGAVADGSTDSSAAAQTAINYAMTLEQGAVIFPRGADSYIIHDIDIDGSYLKIDASQAYFENNTTDNMFNFGATTAAQFIDINIGRLNSRSTSGHIFNVVGGLWHAKVYVGILAQNNADKSILECTTGSLYFDEFDGRYYNMHSASTVPGFNISGATNICSDNRFVFNRADRSGSAHFISIKCTGAGSYNYSNVIDMQFEVVDGGGIALYGCAQHKIANGQFHDMNVGTPANDMILLSSSGSGEACLNTIIEGCARTSGTLAGATYDINLQDADNTTIINCGSQGSSPGYAINVNGKTATIVSPKNATLANATSDCLILGPEGADKIAPFRSNASATIASGVITVNNSYMTVDTEASAATDDLDTINGGQPGMRLVLQTVSNGRDVTIKHGTGNIFLAGSTDFTLDNTKDTIELIYNSSISAWCQISSGNNGA